MFNPFNTDAFRILFRFAGLSAIFYGAYIWVFNCFKGYSAFSLYNDASVLAFSLPLIVGGLIQFVACCRYHRWWAVTGTAINASIFLAAEFSCFQSHPSTGVPAYAFIAGSYILMIFCVIAKPLPCPPKP